MYFRFYENKKFFLLLLLILCCVPRIYAETSPKSQGRSNRIFDLDISTPLNFIGVQDFPTLAGDSDTYTAREPNFNIQVNADFYIRDDSVLGLYYERIVCSTIKSFSGGMDEYLGTGTNGMGIRYKKEFCLFDRISMEPYFGVGLYYLDSFSYSLPFRLSGMSFGTDIGIDFPFYLNDSKDASLVVGIGYRFINFDSLTDVQYDQPPIKVEINGVVAKPSVDFSGFYLNFIQLKATYSEDHIKNSKIMNSDEYTPFIKIGGGFVTANGDANFYWNDQLTASLEGGIEFPDGVGFFLEGEWLSFSYTEDWSLTANIQYTPPFFKLVKPYITGGIGPDYMDRDSTSGTWGAVVQGGFGMEYELTKSIECFIEGKIVSEIGSGAISESFPVQAGLKYKL